MSSSGSERPYLPAAGRDLFLPAYDPIMRLWRLFVPRRKALPMVK